MLALLHDLGDRRHLHKAALAENRGPAADGRHLAQIVRRQQDRRPGVGRLTDQVQHGLAHERVQAGGRLIKDQHLRLMLERADHRHLLAIALGQIAHRTIQIQLKPFRQRFAPRGYTLTAAQGRENAQRSPRLGTSPDAELPRQIADPRMLRAPPRLDAFPQDTDLPAAGPQQAHDATDRRGLARAVGPEIPEDLAGLDGEGDVLDPPRPPVPFCQRPDLNRRHA